MACVSMAAAAPRVMCAAQRSDASRRASRRGVLAATLVTTVPLPARALDVEALEEAVRDSNVDILRMADPRTFMNPAEIELERELGRPTGEPPAVGVTPGEDGERGNQYFFEWTLGPEHVGVEDEVFVEAWRAFFRALGGR